TTRRRSGFSSAIAPSFPCRQPPPTGLACTPGTVLGRRLVDRLVGIDGLTDWTEVDSASVVEHQTQIADLAQHLEVMAGQDHDLAATDAVAHARPGLVHELGVAGAEPLVHQHDVVLHA